GGGGATGVEAGAGSTGVDANRRRKRATNPIRTGDSGVGGSGAGGSGEATGTCSGSSTVAGPSEAAVIVTFVPHPEGSSRTVPLTCSPSQATVVSGSSLLIRISPTASPR